MNDLDLRRLRYFVVVAEELNFSRAATRLQLAQQSLSTAIARLERELGTALFVRTTRRVELTDSGRAFLAPARLALAAGADAVAAARTGQAVAGTVRFGISSGARYGLNALLRTVAETYPEITIEVHHDSALPLLAQVTDGRLDIAAVFAAQVPPELGSLLLREERFVVAVTRNHPLAERAEVALADLSHETIALDAPEANPDYNAAVLRACAEAGFEPNTLSPAGLHDSWEDAVHTHGCVGLTVTSALHASHRDLHLLDLVEDIEVPIHLVWRTESPRRQPVDAVIATAPASRHPRGSRPALTSSPRIVTRSRPCSSS